MMNSFKKESVFTPSTVEVSEEEFIEVKLLLPCLEQAIYNAHHMWCKQNIDSPQGESPFFKVMKSLDKFMNGKL